MATLWTFGDSLTAGFSKDYEWSKSYIEWKGYQPKVYGDFISEKLDLNFVNLGRGASDNYTIFEIFCNAINKFNDGDMVVFGWTSPIRFRLANKKNNWASLLPSYNGNYSSIRDISVDNIQEMFIHRENVRFCIEVNNWIKLIDNFLENKNIKIIHWTTFDNRLAVNFFREIETISQETNGLISDPHFSENGHLVLAERLIKLSNTQKVKILI
jgi:hypothetical protein